MESRGNIYARSTASPDGTRSTPSRQRGRHHTNVDAKSSDTGIAREKGYDYRYRVSGADEFGDWKDVAASPQRVAKLTAGTMYMFEVRAVGMTTRSSGLRTKKTEPARPQ